MQFLNALGGGDDVLIFRRAEHQVELKVQLYAPLPARLSTVAC
jgi:hypothetical protein